MIGVGIRDGQGIVVDKGGGDAVLRLVDGLDLVIIDMEVGGEAVTRDVVGLVEAARGNCVAEIDPEDIILPEHSLLIDFLPGIVRDIS